MSTLTQNISGWQAGFLAILPAVQTHAQIKFKNLTANQREESVQEAIAAAVIAYRRLAAQGRLHVAYPSSIANNAVRHVRNGRHVGGHQDAAKDVLSPACQQRHGVRVQCYYALGDVDYDGWRQMAIADRKASVPDLVAFRIDFAAWLRSHGSRDRKIILILATGESTRTIAKRFGISEGRVSQLRREYEQDWRTIHSEIAVHAA